MASEKGDDVTVIEDVKFDPSDYLPRRTNRASAQAASKAIKKSIEKEKIDPAKLKWPESSKKIKTSFSRKQTLTSKQSSHEHNCFVKVVRCDEDPSWKDLVQKHLCEQKCIGSNNKRRHAEICDGFNPEDGDLLPRKKHTKTKYEVVYSPSEKSALSFFSKPDSRGKVASYHCVNADGKMEDLEGHKPKSFQINYNGPIFRSNGPSAKQVVMVYPKPGTPIIQYSNKQTVSRYASKSTKSMTMMSQSQNVFGEQDVKPVPQKSLSIVMVHPKPGSKIINAGHTGKSNSKSRLLHKMIEDPTVVISNKVEVLTSGGNYGMPCAQCGLSFSMAKDLVSHKRMVHKSLDPPDVTSGSEFPYICPICCFSAQTSDALNLHTCGGRPAKGSVRDYRPKTKPVPIIVYPKLKALAESSPGGSKKFLCEMCLNMFTNARALASHTCHPDLVVLDDKPSESSSVSSILSSNTSKSASTSTSTAAMDRVLPEVEQLAKFYSSVVFQEK